jgi:hypothetical protein
MPVPERRPAFFDQNHRQAKTHVDADAEADAATTQQEKMEDAP